MTLLALAAHAADIPASFTGLVHIGHGIHAPPGTKPMRRTLPGEVERTQIAELELGGERYAVIFDEGPSADPTLSIATGPDARAVVFSVGMDRAFITASGNLYVERRSNATFTERRKYVWKGDRYVEVEQPLQYVGLETKVGWYSRMQEPHPPGTITVSLLAEPRAGASTVATLPEGAPVTVLLARDERWFLVATSFGLVGWIEDPPDYTSYLELVYHGD